MSTWTLDDFAQLIDHTNLHPDATEDDIRRLCDEAKRHHFKMVAINQTQACFCSEQLAGTDIHVGAAIAFPLGQTTIAAKVFETCDALKNGANEIDYVVNLTQVKEHNWKYVSEEMSEIVDACDRAGVPSKVIFENCYLTQDEKLHLCKIAREVRPTFVKTSTGFGTGGATVADVELMCAHVGDGVLVKAAGGIRDADTFLAMIRAGARRIGTSSGVAIIEELARRMEEASVSTLEL
ncbi:MAG: deoxyribose-phosphate aldolase [Atopobiaceae bacterium]|nr:deoxyribose-phosphate aldolase [Atopobiaceae bacterium]